MHKTPTIFERDWDGNRGVIDRYAVDPERLRTATATEKLDGTNVRLTVRNRTLVRLEKRRNPSKLEKAKGIEEPWYVDADEHSPDDRFIWEAARHTDLAEVPDGEWAGEALGPKIQGNPLGLSAHVVVLFSLGQAPELEDVPTTFAELRAWLPRQASRYGTGPIEGVVWHCGDGTMMKIKAKDFK
jgi:hypothetical protein